MNSLKSPRSFYARQALEQHWQDYVIEAWALGVFMLVASLVSTALESPGALLNKAISNNGARLGLIGIAMGATAVLLIYSPWGKRSGAHMNPAVTLAFLFLRRISPINALFYILAQVLGGLIGVLVAAVLLGERFAEAPVQFIVTQPGPAGAGVAFLAEFAISLGLMLTILLVSNARKLAPYTGIAAGVLITLYVSVESPLSGMSMNPARTLASALPAHYWHDLWIYFTAPVAGMLSAAQIFHVLTPWAKRRHHSAKVVPTGNA
jgi:aquaporin Z